MNQPACHAVAYTTPQHPGNPNKCWMKTALENCRASEGYITGNFQFFYLAVISLIAFSYTCVDLFNVATDHQGISECEYCSKISFNSSRSVK